MPPDFNSLIPELASWNEGKGIDVVSWLEGIGRYDHAVAYAALFWPEFVVHDGCIFFEAPKEQTYRAWMEKLHGDRTRVEQMLNHRHSADLFYKSEFKPTDEVLKHVGQVLLEMGLASSGVNFRRPECRLSGTGMMLGNLKSRSSGCGREHRRFAMQCSIDRFGGVICPVLAASARSGCETRRGRGRPGASGGRWGVHR